MSIGRPLNLTALRLAPTTRGALWILLSGICAVMMNVLIRVAAQDMHPFEVAFFRCFFGFVFIFPWIVKSAPYLLRSRNRGFFLLRAGVGLVSMATWFYGITVVPLATATAVNFTAPLFATMAAAFILREDVRLRRWSAVVLGFLGVLVIMRPGGARFDVNLLLLLLSAATAAMNNITVKFLARSESPSRIVAFFMIYLTPLSLIPALFVWQWPDPSTFGALIGLGCLGTIAHFSVARLPRPTPAPARRSSSPGYPLPRSSAFSGLARLPTCRPGSALRSSRARRSTSPIARLGLPEWGVPASRACPRRGLTGETADEDRRAGGNCQRRRIGARPGDS
jgi:drug/metabolite transporter (DMT)-like permease